MSFFAFVHRISGGELFERIIDEDFELTEREVIKYMLQIIDGVNFIHKQGVVHLDLKPENIMCVNKTGSKIKLIDFGLARRLGRYNRPKFAINILACLLRARLLVNTCIIIILHWFSNNYSIGSAIGLHGLLLQKMLVLWRFCLGLQNLLPQKWSTMKPSAMQPTCGALGSSATSCESCPFSLHT